MASDTTQALITAIHPGSAPKRPTRPADTSSLNAKWTATAAGSPNGRNTRLLIRREWVRVPPGSSQEGQRLASLSHP